MTLTLNAPFMRQLSWEQTRLRLSQQVRGLRHGKGWTQGQLAKRAGVTLRDVWRLENGYLTHVSLKTLTKISHAFDVAFHVQYISLKDSLRQMKHPVTLPVSFEQEIAPS